MITDKIKHELHVCRQMRYAPNPLSCGNTGSETIMVELENEIAKNNLDIEVIPKNCMLMCDVGPNIKLMPEKIIWNKVTLNNIPSIINNCKKVLNID